METQTFIPRQGKLQIHSFDNATNADIMRVAPSVFAQDRYMGTTKETYQHVSTATMLAAMREQGWNVTGAGQKFTRSEDRYAYTRHFLRLRHADAPTNGEYVPEAILLNGHDGSTAYRFYTGAFRFVCSNGLVFGEMVQSVRMHHSLRQCGTAGALALEATKALLACLPEQMGMIERLSSIKLTEAQMYQYAELALRVRWPQDTAKVRNIPILPEDVLVATLEADKPNNAWTVFNRVQYHLVTQGEVQGKSATGRNVQSRPVTRVDKMLAVNIGLWNTMLQVAGIAKDANVAAKAKPTVSVPALPAPAKAAKAKKTAPKAEPKAPKAKAKKALPAPAKALPAPKGK